jgi:hypothetical protein
MRFARPAGTAIVEHVVVDAYLPIKRHLSNSARMMRAKRQI